MEDRISKLEEIVERQGRFIQSLEAEVMTLRAEVDRLLVRAGEKAPPVRPKYEAPTMDEIIAANQAEAFRESDVGKRMAAIAPPGVEGFGFPEHGRR